MLNKEKVIDVLLYSLSKSGKKLLINRRYDNSVYPK